MVTQKYKHQEYLKTILKTYCKWAGCPYIFPLCPNARCSGKLVFVSFSIKKKVTFLWPLMSLWFPPTILGHFQTVPRNEKHFPLFSCGIQQHSNTTTAAQGPNEFFLLLIWLQKPFHLYKSNWNLNCLLFRKYIYFPVCFLLLF